MEDPKFVHGRLAEAVHMTGYSFERACRELEWLLEDNRWKQCGAGFERIDDFLETVDFSEFKIPIEQRKKLAKKLTDLRATQRAVAGTLGVDPMTVNRDVRPVEIATKQRVADTKENDVSVENATPPSFQHSAQDAARLLDQKTLKTEKKAEHEERIEAIKKNAIYTESGPWDVLILDPPWPYGTTYDPQGRRVANPYPEMSIDEIIEMKDKPLKEAAKDDCILWLWTTHKFMRHSFPILDAWGFQDVSILTWVKDRMGTGSWLRSQSEYCIMAIKGKPVHHLTNQTTILHGPLREHSQKPEEFYEMVKQLCPGTIGEYFPRIRREGIAPVLSNELAR